MLLKSAPRDLRQILKRLKDGTFDFTIQHKGLERYLTELDRTGNRLALSIILAAIIMSSTTMMAEEVGPLIYAFGTRASLLGLLGYTFGFLLGVLLVVGIFRSGRL
jgi:ubiquinone biosynthesis protein